MKRSVRLVFGLCFILNVGLATADPLFNRLQGTWKGAGNKKYLATGITIPISATKTFSNESERLVVRSFSIEKGSNGEFETRKVNWIRQKQDLGQYEFGTGTGEFQFVPTALGWYDGKVFELIDQNSDETVKIHSRSWYHFISESQLDWYTELLSDQGIVVKSWVQFEKNENSNSSISFKTAH